MFIRASIKTSLDALHMDLNGEGRYQLAILGLLIMCLYDVIKAVVYVMRSTMHDQQHRAVETCPLQRPEWFIPKYKCAKRWRRVRLSSRRRTLATSVPKLDREVDDDPGATGIHVIRERLGSASRHSESIGKYPDILMKIGDNPSKRTKRSKASITSAS